MRSAVTRPADHVRQRTNQRDAALARVSRLTTGTAVAGALATVGFAGLAALTFSGNATATDNNQVTTDSSTDQNTQGLTPTTDGSSSNSNGSTSTSHGTQATQAPGYTYNQGSTTVNPPVVHHGRSHVSTGGS